MKYYAIIKNNNLLICSTKTWINFKSTIPGKFSSIILPNIFSMLLVLSFSPSGMPIICMCVLSEGIKESDSSPFSHLLMGTYHSGGDTGIFWNRKSEDWDTLLFHFVLSYTENERQ